MTFRPPRQTLAWLSDGTADWFWPAAEKADACRHVLAVGEVPRFARIAERRSQLTLIVDHMGLNCIEPCRQVHRDDPGRD